LSPLPVEPLPALALAAAEEIPRRKQRGLRHGSPDPEFHGGTSFDEFVDRDDRTDLGSAAEPAKVGCRMRILPLNGSAATAPDVTTAARDIARTVHAHCPAVP